MSALKSKIEALLFASGEETTVKRLKRVLGEASEDEIGACLAELEQEYLERGIRILRKDEKVQMVTAPEHGELIGALVKSHLTEELTPAALETLACVAYKEPIAKAEVDELRGVNSIFSLRNLLMRGLIEKIEDSDGVERYHTTLDFLKKLGIRQVRELPHYEELRSQGSAQNQ